MCHCVFIYPPLSLWGSDRWERDASWARMDQRVSQHVPNEPASVSVHHEKTQCCEYAGNTPQDPLPSAVCRSSLLHPELSPLRWSACERGPRQPPWLTRQTRPVGRRPPGPKGHTRLRVTSYGRRSSADVESDPPHPWAGSSSSTLLWMVRRGWAAVHITSYSRLQTRRWSSFY